MGARLRSSVAGPSLGTLMPPRAIVRLCWRRAASEDTLVGVTKLDAGGEPDLILGDDGKVAVKTASVGGVVVFFLEQERPGQSVTQVGDDKDAIDMVQG